MVVLHVTPCLAPAWACGAVAHRVARLARAQAALGATVTVLTTDVTAPHERLPPGDTVDDGLRTVRVRTANRSSRWSIGLTLPVGFGTAARRLLAEQSFDVVHLHEVRTLENAAVASIARAPFVLSTHGAFAHGHTPRATAWIWDRVHARRVLRRVRCVVADAPADVECARQLWAWRRVPLADTSMCVRQPPPADAFAEGLPDDAWRAYAAFILDVYGQAMRLNRPAAREARR